MKKSLSEKEHRENLLMLYNHCFLLMIAIIGALVSIIVTMVVIYAQLGVGTTLGTILIFILFVLGIFLGWAFSVIAFKHDRIGKKLGIPETLKKMKEGSA
jgi:hypothetical protein